MSYNHEPQHDHGPTPGLSPNDTVPVATYNRMVRKRDEAVAAVAALTTELDQARQMLADAPHSYYCGTVIGNACRCWKAEL